jgi:CBS-domain-containing membrane protein
MRERGISGLPVVDDEGRLVGMLTEGDLMARIEPDSVEEASKRWLHLAAPDGLAREFVLSHSWRVSDIMSAPVVTVNEDTPLREVAELIATRNIRRLPVMRGNQMVGIVSRADLLDAIVLAQDPANRPVKGDDAIRTSVEARLRDAKRIITGAPAVTVNSGIVHLWGVLGSKSERDALRVIVEGVPGIAGFEDHTTLDLGQA